jgi:hypothetical protein
MAILYLSYYKQCTGNNDIDQIMDKFIDGQIWWWKYKMIKSAKPFMSVRPL